MSGGHLCNNCLPTHNTFSCMGNSDDGLSLDIFPSRCIELKTWVFRVQIKLAQFTSIKYPVSSKRRADRIASPHSTIANRQILILLHFAIERNEWRCLTPRPNMLALSHLLGSSEAKNAVCCYRRQFVINGWESAQSTHTAIENKYWSDEKRTQWTRRCQCVNGRTQNVNYFIDSVKSAQFSWSVWAQFVFVR